MARRDWFSTMSYNVMYMCCSVAQSNCVECALDELFRKEMLEAVAKVAEDSEEEEDKKY